MTKKIRKQNKKTVQQTHAGDARVLFERALKRAISRINAQCAAPLYDCALPSDIRFHGIISKYQTRQTPHVGITDSVILSPFILELRKTQNTNVVMIPDTYESVRLNFIPESFPLQSEVTNIDTSRDLELSLEDIPFYDNIKTPAMDKPVHTIVNQIMRPFIAWRKRDDLKSIPIQISQNIQRLSLESFIPKQIPEDIFSYFDLPEEEQNETNDADALIEFADLTQEAEETPIIIPHKKSSFDFHLPQWSFSFLFPNNWQRMIGVFVLLSFVFVLPIHAMQVISNLRAVKSNAQTSGTQALVNLQNVTGANLVSNPLLASASFSKARLQFGQANQSINQLGKSVSLLLATLGPTKNTFKTSTALLKTGEELSLAGERLTEGLSALQTNINSTPSSRIEILRVYLTAAEPHLVAAQNSLNDVKTDIVNESYRSMVIELKTLLPTLIKSTQEFLSLSDTLLSILGTQETKHYLLVFQNNTEIRPTGGFMGSFAELSVHNGIVEKFDVPGGGTYDIKGQLRTPLVSPWPLQLVSAKWEFQDANWFPDFPQSARQIIQFYKDAGGSDIDGVIAINADSVVDFLKLLGPIDMPEYGRVIDENNFLLETQKIVEQEYDKTENKPKAFIGDLAPKLIAKTKDLNPEQFMALADQFISALHNRDIQLYFTNDKMEQAVRSQNWSGEIKQTEKDYLMLVDTNLGGGKTDGVIDERVDLDVSIAANGIITNTATITRTHNGKEGDLFANINNVNYIRLYVPKGSTLLQAKGFDMPSTRLFETPEPNWIVDPDLQFSDESFSVDDKSKTQIYEEVGKTVFANWTQTRPGETTTATFTYNLPFTFSKLMKKNNFIETIQSLLGVHSSDKYSLLVQKQSGMKNRTTVVRIHIPDNLRLLWNSDNLSHFEINNMQDGFLGALFEPAL